jgi:hypothetical protein
LTNFATSWGKDVGGGNVKLGERSFAYIDGVCEIRLPAGPITVEIHKGFEYAPHFETITLSPGKLALRFTIKRAFDLRTDGWFSGDCDTILLSPNDALLEAAAEDLAVVNLLAFERHEQNSPIKFISNIVAFSGQEPAISRPGHMVVVNTLNTCPLGHLLLLNCHRAVYPLSLGSLDGFDAWTMGDWCDQCHRKGGLVVWSEPWPAGPEEPIGEPLAHLLLGKVDALEIDGLGPEHALIEEWYRLLNCGCRFPLAATSSKCWNQGVVGAARVYSKLEPGPEFTYKNWIEAVRIGRTFVTNGPLITLQVDGSEPGAVIDLPGDGKVVITRAEARGIVPFKRLELVVNGELVAECDATGQPTVAVLEAELPIKQSCWIAARCFGDECVEGALFQSRVYAHTAPIYVVVAGKPHRPDQATIAPLIQELDRMVPWAVGLGFARTDQQRERLANIFRSARQVLVDRQSV